MIRTFLKPNKKKIIVFCIMMIPLAIAFAYMAWFVFTDQYVSEKDAALLELFSIIDNETGTKDYVYDAPKALFLQIGIPFFIFVAFLLYVSSCAIVYKYEKEKNRAVS